MRFEWYLRPLKSSDDGVRQARRIDHLTTVAVWESALPPKRGRLCEASDELGLQASALKTIPSTLIEVFKNTPILPNAA
jgi:hypothetical protein